MTKGLFDVVAGKVGIEGSGGSDRHGTLIIVSEAMNYLELSPDKTTAANQPASRERGAIDSDAR